MLGVSDVTSNPLVNDIISDNFENKKLKRDAARWCRHRKMVHFIPMCMHVLVQLILREASFIVHLQMI